jgi:hypothetical protein
MRKRTVSEPIPKCDFCRDRKAKFDAPTKWGGFWAYMCEPCSKVHSSEEMVNRLGTEFIEKEE